jgi:hypothetical protein
MQCARHCADLAKRSSKFDTDGLSYDRSLATSIVLQEECRVGRYRASQRIFLRKWLQVTLIYQEWWHDHSFHRRLRGSMGLTTASFHSISTREKVSFRKLTCNLLGWSPLLALLNRN